MHPDELPSARDARRRLYERWFGAPAEVHAGDAADVFVFAPDAEHDPEDVLTAHVAPPPSDRAAPRTGRTFFTLLTSGLSDRRMSAPADAGPARARAELVLYTADPPAPAVVNFLATLAALPRSGDLWLGPGHTLPNGDPPAPLFGGSLLSAVLFLDAVLAPERDLHRLLEIDGDPVRMLWPVPITAEECRYKLERGTPALLDVFNAARLPCELDPRRASLV